MSGVGRRIVRDAFCAVDRALGGRQRPTRFQKFVVRHPLGLGLATGVPLATVLVVATLPDHSVEESLVGVCFGAAMGAVFGLTALSERYRQRRLRRLGLWDGS